MELKRGQIPSYEELYDRYITSNNTVRDLMMYYCRSKSCIENWLKNYSIKKPKELHQEIILKSVKNKYGVDNISQIESVNEKVKKTNREKFGCDYYAQTEEFKSRVENTSKIRYGASNPAKNADVKEKIRKTFKEKYGNEVIFKTKYFKDKVVEYNQNKYGVNWNSQQHLSNEILEIIHSEDKFREFMEHHQGKTSKEIASLLGVSVPLILQYAHIYNCFDYIDSYTSSYEIEIRDFLAQHNIHLEKDRKIIYPKEIDLYNSESKIGIEFNGDYWHSTKEPLYNQNKSMLAESKGVFLFQIFEYEWVRNKDKIKQQLLKLFDVNQHIIYARKCELREVSIHEKNEFLNKWHLQGEDKSQIKIGLYYNEELISIMTFSKARFNRDYQWEIIRYCTKGDIKVVGGASKLFKYFREHYTGNVISYSNIAKFRGDVYHSLGFKLKQISSPNYVWVNLSTGDVKSRYACQMKNENKIMTERGYVQIYDCGNKVWTLD